MEPVTVTSSVRRTVRLAVALVVGQALLCALIGWLTLGSARDESGRTEGPIVDQLAAPAPPGLAPTVPTTVPQSVAAASAAAATTTATPRRTGSRRATSAPPARPPREGRSPAPPSASPTPPRETTAPPGLINLPPPPPLPSVSGSPSPSERVQEPVTVGERCRPEGAFGRTEDGVEVRCLRSWNRGPRWKIA